MDATKPLLGILLDHEDTKARKKIRQEDSTDSSQGAKAQHDDFQ